MTEQTQTMKLIKKYKNRRLYDLERSQYVTIEDLQAYVLQDLPFKVIDATTDKDLTNATLLQIFVELENHSTEAFSPQVLRQLIKLSKHPMSQHYKTLLGEMLTKMHDHTDPFIQNVQTTTEFWVKQSEQFMKSWQDWLLNQGK